MPTLTFVVPIRAGQAEAWRRLAQELSGSRCQDYAAARCRLGIQREVMGLAEAGAGALVIVRLEAGDPQTAIERLSASDLPFEHWFREQWLALAGQALARSARAGQVEQIFEWNAAERSAAEQNAS